MLSPQSSIAIGILLIAAGGFGTSSSYVPIRKVREWSWESYWLVQGLFAWLLLPFLGALLGRPEGVALASLYGNFPIWKPILYGVFWGFGGLAFGLGMRYLGVALGQSVSQGTCAAFGTLLPALMAGTDLLHGQGLVLLVGICLAVAGIAVISYAGVLRTRTMPEERRRLAIKDFALKKGLVVALASGVVASCFSLGIEAGAPLTQAALDTGANPLFAGLPTIFLVTLGGFVTNAAYCIQQNIANHTGRDYFRVSAPVFFNNLVFCLLAGLLWYSQFLGLEMGKSFLRPFPVLVALSWSLLMSLNVVFSNLWGIILKEWKSCSLRTKAVLVAGLALLIVSIFFPSFAA